MGLLGQGTEKSLLITSYFLLPAKASADALRAARTWPVVGGWGQQVSHLGVLQSFHPLHIQGSEQRTAGGAKGRDGRPGASRQQQHTQTFRGQQEKKQPRMNKTQNSFPNPSVFHFLFDGEMQSFQSNRVSSCNKLLISKKQHHLRSSV